MSLTLHPLASYGHKALIALSEDDVALTARNNSIGHVGAAKARSSY
ncbi:MAG: hypothetical protein QOF07_1760 [Bradyrhizobium sp.]|jgi:hypothetical protein|nr:hypothetical protein [Bradyrhizobium sp.]